MWSQQRALAIDECRATPRIRFRAGDSAHPAGADPPFDEPSKTANFDNSGNDKRRRGGAASQQELTFCKHMTARAEHAGSDCCRAHTTSVNTTSS